eukprot:RCo016688
METFEVEVIYPYQSAEKSQLSLRRREKIVVLQADSSGWWIGRNSRGQVGIFPSTYTSVGLKHSSNAEHPFEGVDKENKAVLWKMVEQLFREKKQLAQEKAQLMDELGKARTKSPPEVAEELASEARELGTTSADSSQLSIPLSGFPDSLPQAKPVPLQEMPNEAHVVEQDYATPAERNCTEIQDSKPCPQCKEQLTIVLQLCMVHGESEARSELHRQWLEDHLSLQAELHKGLVARVLALEPAAAELNQTQQTLQVLREAHSQVEGLPAALAELQGLYRAEAAERRRLYNIIQDLKGKVRVFCRLRPLLGTEAPPCGAPVAVLSVDGSRVRIDDPQKPNGGYEFDNCFGPESSQQDVFEAVQPVITSVLDGYNVCIFAYGQTGSGKTYTVEGSAAQPGISYRTVQLLFEQIAGRAEAYTYTVSITCIEVYNDAVYDLLRKGNRDERRELRLVNGSCQVVDVTTVPVSSVAEVQPLLRKALSLRNTNSTTMNERSSRSHCILTFYVSGKSKVTSMRVHGKLHLIDLAGSERSSKSKAEGDRLCEANCINKSLSNLGRVIVALHHKQAHVPFRDCKLTYLLQDSLGGDSKTILIANISPAPDCLGETYSTIAFATSVRKLELGEAKRHVTSSSSADGPIASLPS